MVDIEELVCACLAHVKDPSKKLRKVFVAESNDDGTSTIKLCVKLPIKPATQAAKRQATARRASSTGSTDLDPHHVVKSRVLSAAMAKFGPFHEPGTIIEYKDMTGMRVLATHIKDVEPVGWTCTQL